VYESRFEDLVQMLPAIGKAFYIPDPAADRSFRQSMGIFSFLGRPDDRHHYPNVA